MPNSIDGVPRIPQNSQNSRIPAELEKTPLTQELQDLHLDARARLGLHVTNIVKCYAETKFETNQADLWRQAASACCDKFLKVEFELVDPECVVLLGSAVAQWFSAREGWGYEALKISEWADQAADLSCFGKKRFVTAWPHTGGNYFHIQGKVKWPLYAEQLAKFV